MVHNSEGCMVTTASLPPCIPSPERDQCSPTSCASSPETCDTCAHTRARRALFFPHCSAQWPGPSSFHFIVNARPVHTPTSNLSSVSRVLGCVKSAFPGLTHSLLSLVFLNSQIYKEFVFITL